MQSQWNNHDASRHREPLSLRAYASRLLGADDTLVFYGGGNTSIKIDDVLYVKGTGSDLATVTEASFTPLHLTATRQVLRSECADNAAMMRALDGCLAKQIGRAHV